MKHLLKYLLGTAACLMTLAACSDSEEGIVPPTDLQTLNFRSEPGPGTITLKWNLPDNPDYYYLQLTYLDPREKKDRMLTISSYTDSLVIENTRARYGEYTFTLTPFSETGTPGTPITLKATSGPAEKTLTTSRIPVSLTSDNFTTNAQEPSEGPLSNICDGNASTFFHSNWSGNSPANHWIDVDFGEPLERFEIVTLNRHNNAVNNPNGVRCFRLSSLGDTSVDMDTATPFLSYTCTNLGAGQQNSIIFPAIEEDALTEPIRYMRFVTRGNGNKYWNLAEFSINKIVVTVYDPEVDEVPEYDE